MDNLKYTPVWYLHNAINAENIIIKDSALAYLDQAGKYSVAQNVAMTVDKTFLGHGRSQFVKINLNGPATTGVPYSLQFEVKIEQKEPGIGNDNPRINLDTRAVSGEVLNPVVTAGVIDSATEELLLDSLLDSIKKDAPLSESDFYEGRKGYYVQETATAAVVAINGVNTAASGADTAEALAVVINAISGVLAVPVSDDTVFITTDDNATDLLIEAGANTTLLERGLYVTSAKADARAQVRADKDFFVIGRQSLLSINYANTVVDGDGGITLFTQNADNTTGTYHIADKDAADIVTGINGSALVNTTVRAYAIGSVVYVARVYQTTGNLIKISTDIQSVVTFGWNLTEKGTFSANSYMDLDRRFVGRYAGQLHSIRQNRTIVDAEYVILQFVISGTSPGLSGAASNNEGFTTHVNVVIEKTLFFDSVRWNTAMDAAGTDKYLFEVINGVYAGSIV